LALKRVAVQAGLVLLAPHLLLAAVLACGAFTSVHF
jgi:hypothetical protein